MEDRDRRMAEFAGALDAMTNYLKAKHADNPEIQENIKRFGFNKEVVQKLIINIEELSSDHEGWQIKISCGDKSQVTRLINPFNAAQEERLRWSVEDHIVLEPFNKITCQRSCEELTAYGKQLFDLLQLKMLVDGNTDSTDIVINIFGAAKASTVNSIHWEVLEDPKLWQQSSITGSTVMVKRCFTTKPIQDRRLKSTFNIVYVAARPIDLDYIEHRLLSRRVMHIIENIKRDAIDVQCHILRPGTWGALVLYLDSIRQSKGSGQIDLVHFDMHGRFNANQQYCLDFVCEDDSTAEPRPAIHVAKLLAQHQIRTVVLNACESASNRASAASNLATIFIENGIASVVAMSSKINTDSAGIFLSGFYNSLLDGVPDVAMAVYEGRKSMREIPSRQGNYNTTLELHDWIIPVHYFSSGYQLSGTSYTRDGDLIQYDLDGNANLWPLAPERVFARFEQSENATEEEEHAASRHLDNSFYGRDFDILQLETELSKDSSRWIILTGPPDVGKTTLLRHLEPWWHKTGFFSIICTTTLKENGAIQQIMEWTNWIQWYEEGNPQLRTIEATEEQSNTKQYFISRLERGQPPVVIIDDLDALSEWAQPNFEAEDLDKLCSTLERLKQTKSRVILVSRSGSVQSEGFQKAIQDFLEMRLQGLTPLYAANLATSIISPGHDNTLDENDISTIEHINKVLDYLPGVIETMFYHCSAAGMSMRLDELLKSLLYDEMNYPVRTRLFETFEPLFHRDGPLGSDGFMSVLLLAPFRLQCPVDLLPYFMQLVRHERFYQMEIPPSFVTNAKTEMALSQATDVNANIDDEVITTTLRAQVAEIHFRKMLAILSEFGLLREESESIWIHPGLTIFSRKVRAYQTIFKPPIERSFVYFMISQYNLPEQISQQIYNCIMAINLAGALLGTLPMGNDVLTFSIFARGYLTNMMQSISRNNSDFLSNNLDSVALRTLKQNFQTPESRERNPEDFSWALQYLNVLGDHYFGRIGIRDMERSKEFYKLVLELGNGIAVPAQAEVWYFQAKARIALLEGEDEVSYPISDPLANLRLEYGRSLLHLRLKVEETATPSEELTSLFRDCQAAWVLWKNKSLEMKQQPSELLSSWTISILETSMEDKSPQEFDELALAFARTIDHENDSEHGMLCFEIEAARIRGDIGLAKDIIYQGLNEAAEEKKLSMEYDLRRYLLELTEEFNPDEDSSDQVQMIRNLANRLGQDSNVFCFCRKSRKALERSSKQHSDPETILRCSIKALEDACFLCKLTDHQHRILVSFTALPSEFPEADLLEIGVYYLGLCVKNQGHEWIRPSNIGDGSKAIKSPFSLEIFYPNLLQPCGETDGFIGGYVWKVNVKLMKVVVLLSGCTWRQLIEKLIQAYGKASEIEIHESDFETGVNIEQRLAERATASWLNEEKALFAKDALLDVGSSNLRSTETNQKLLVNEDGLRKWFSILNQTPRLADLDEHSYEVHDKEGENEAMHKFYGVSIDSGKLTSLAWVDDGDTEENEAGRVGGGGGRGLERRLEKGRGKGKGKGKCNVM